MMQQKETFRDWRSFVTVPETAQTMTGHSCPEYREPSPAPTHSQGQPSHAAKATRQQTVIVQAAGIVGMAADAAPWHSGHWQGDRGVGLSEGLSEG